MELASAVLGLIASLASLGSAWDTFSGVGLPVKLIVTLVGFCLLVYAAARALAKAAKKDPPPDPWADPPPSPSLARLAASGAALAVLCAIGVGLAIFLTDRFTLRVRETPVASAARTLYSAPSLAVAKVVLELPPKPDSVCDYKNMSLDDTPPLELIMVAWEKPTPQLQISNFVRPQRLEVSCSPAGRIRVMAPARTEIYSETALARLKWITVAVGGLVWLVASASMWRWSR